MSAAEKRAFDIRKREERIFNKKFKKVFTAIVSFHLACKDSSNKIIDMNVMKEAEGEEKKILVDT